MAICEVDLFKNFNCILISLKSLTDLSFKIQLDLITMFLRTPQCFVFLCDSFWHNVIVPNSIDEALETLDQAQLKS